MNASENGGIRVCLVDDNPFERGNFETWIRQDNGIEILGSFDDLESALPVMCVANPDVALLDYGLPGIKGGAAVRRVKMEIPSCRVLVVTGIPSNDVVFEALEAGADGFLDKEGITAKGLLGEIRAAHEGRAPLSDRARRLVLEKLQAERPNLAEWNKLTDREKEIASLLKRGLPDKEIAHELDLSLSTIRTYLERIFKRLDAHDRFEVQVRLWGGGARVNGEEFRSLLTAHTMPRLVGDFHRQTNTQMSDMNFRILKTPFEEFSIAPARNERDSRSVLPGKRQKPIHEWALRSRESSQPRLRSEGQVLGKVRTDPVSSWKDLIVCTCVSDVLERVSETGFAPKGSLCI